MRQRSGSNGANGKRLQDISDLDLFGKVHDDYKVKTQSGGAIAIVSYGIIFVLFATELGNYLRVEVVDHIVVDTTLDQKLPIGVNITFPRLRCDEVSVDTVDSMGGNQLDIVGGLHKENLNKDGIPHDGEIANLMKGCGSCLEANDFEPDRCCNNCAEVRQAYTDNGLPYYHVLETSPQCKDTVGCRVHGDVLVSKVAGNVHVALGKSRVRDGKHVHEFNIKEVGDGFNTSHSIHRLDFGERVAGTHSVLAGTTKIVKHGAFMFHYYIKLVPTIFEGGGKQIYTHQYSATDQGKNVMVKKGELTGLPGIFFVYEFTPFLVKKVEKQVPLSNFLTSMCAITGGVFTVAGLIDSMLYRGYKHLGGASKKDDL